MIHTDMESVKYLANEIFEKLISVILTKWFINKKKKKTMAVIYVFVRLMRVAFLHEISPCI